MYVYMDICFNVRVNVCVRNFGLRIFERIRLRVLLYVHLVRFEWMCGKVIYYLKCVDQLQEM